MEVVWDNCVCVCQVCVCIWDVFVCVCQISVCLLELLVCFLQLSFLLFHWIPHIGLAVLNGHLNCCRGFETEHLSW